MHRVHAMQTNKNRWKKRERMMMRDSRKWEETRLILFTLAMWWIIIIKLNGNDWLKIMITKKKKKSFAYQSILFSREKATYIHIKNSNLNIVRPNFFIFCRLFSWYWLNHRKMICENIQKNGMILNQMKKGKGHE